MYTMLFTVASATLATEFTSEVATYMQCHSEGQIFLMSLCVIVHLQIFDCTHLRALVIVSKQHEIRLLIPHKVLDTDDAFKEWLHS